MEKLSLENNSEQEFKENEDKKKLFIDFVFAEGIYCKSNSKSIQEYEESFIKAQEIQERLVEQALQKFLRRREGGSYFVNNLIPVSFIAEKLLTEESKKSIFKRLSFILLKDNNFYEYEKLKNILQCELTPEEMRDIFEKTLLTNLRNGNYKKYRELKDKLDTDISKKPEFYEASRECLLNFLLKNPAPESEEMINEFNLTEEDVKQIAEESVKILMTKYSHSSNTKKAIDSIIDHFNLNLKILLEDEEIADERMKRLEKAEKAYELEEISKIVSFYSIEKDALISFLKDTKYMWPSYVLDTREVLGLDDSVVEISILENLDKVFSWSNEDLSKFVEKSNLSDEFWNSEAVISFIEDKKTFYVSGLVILNDILGFKPNTYLRLIKNSLSKEMEKDLDIDILLDVKKQYNLSESFVNNIITNHMIHCIRKLEFNLWYELEKLDNYKQLIKSEEFQKACIEKATDLLMSGNYSDVEEIIFKFDIDIKKIYEKIEEDKRELFNNLENIFPNFVQKALSSTEIFLSIFRLNSDDIEQLEQNENLQEAFRENPSMAIKLLIQYSKFSESPKENIDTILETKRKIMEYNPNIDPNSHEFRLLVQEQLKPYRRNLDILTQMKEEGINIDNWLNYSEETLFELGGEETSYAELIKLPSERIQKTLQKYEEEVRNALSQYKKELLDKQVSLIDVSEIQQRITQMEQLAQEAQEAGNQGKAQGIQKGIEGLKKQLENPKQIPAWLKIMSDIDTVSKLFLKVSEINTQIANLETELATLVQNPSKETQKKMFETKKKTKELSKEFVSLLETTSTRMDSLFVLIQNSLSQTLGKDISEKIISKLNTDLSEDQEHFNSDKATLKNILKMNESDNDFKSTLLKIKVWDRNPDIDLYQGNYSDCCVRIDSEYHGSDSPISDYITDLGIQIVAVYDEKTGKPFATAWCFVGEDVEGNKAFVVDNIEAAGPYMKYRNNLREKLKTYIEKYARALGLEIISQGPHNNDMVVTTNLEEKYTKLGGYNVADGYYLEAEPDEYEEGEEDDEVDQELLEQIEERRLIESYSRIQENIVSIEEAMNRSNIE